MSLPLLRRLSTDGSASYPVHPFSHPSIARSIATRPLLNCVLPADHHWATMLHDLRVFANGTGGILEQSYLYIDSSSAADFIRLSDELALPHYDLHPPLVEPSKAILHHLGPLTHLEIVVLGSGTARTEAQYLKTLIERLPKAATVSICLFDINPLLLQHAHARISSIFSQNTRVFVYALQGNFHRLPDYEQFFRRSKNSKRLVLFLGKTLGHLQDELLFFTQALRELVTGDLLLTDFQLKTPRNSDHGVACSEKNPIVDRETYNYPRVENFVLNTLFRHRDQGTIEELTIRQSSYPHWNLRSSMSELNVTLSNAKGGVAQFILQQKKYYDCNELIRDICKTNLWTYLQGWRFGQAEDCVLYLFQRV